MSTEGFFGTQGLGDSTDQFSMIRYMIRQELASFRTNVPVRVVAVHGGGSGPAGTVDLQPLVNQTDGQGNQTPHGTIYGVPVMRSQGGGNAVICDPRVGDIGQMSVCDRDISSLKASAGQSNPGSFRRGSMSDGVYMGAIVNPGDPTQAVQFTDTGVRIFNAAGDTIELDGGTVTVTAPTVRMTGDLVVDGDVQAGGGAISLLTHRHPGVEPGGGTSGGPV